MVSCLALLHETHAPRTSDGSRRVTACGLAMEEADVRPGLFAEGQATPTCRRCVAAAAAAQPQPDAARDAKSLVMLLFDGVLNANDPARLGACADQALAAKLPASRLVRLHELFPSWRATIVNLIAEGDSVFVRYSVACVDAFGLLGPAGPARKEGQAVIASVSSGRLVAVHAVVDDFSLWSGGGPACAAAACAC